MTAATMSEGPDHRGGLLRVGGDARGFQTFVARPLSAKTRRCDPERSTRPLSLANHYGEGAVRNAREAVTKARQRVVLSPFG